MNVRSIEDGRGVQLSVRTRGLRQLPITEIALTLEPVKLQKLDWALFTAFYSS